MTSTTSPSSSSTSIPMRLERVELRGRVRAGRRARLHLAVDHAVRAVADDGELVAERRVDVRVVAAIVGEPHAERGQELVVGDELLLGADHAPGDLELLLLGQQPRQLIDDPVVLAREQRVRRRQRDVLVGAHVTGDHRLAGHAHQPALERHLRSG